MSDKSPNLAVMINAAKIASKRLIRDFGEIENLQVSKKGPGDFVSNADKRAEETILRELTTARPDYAVLAEESGEQKKDSEFCWVVDPLDGTNNFLHALPYWAISIGLERNGEPVAGVIMAPILNEIFWAEKGQGAFLNDRRIRVSSRSHTNDAFIALGNPSSARRASAAPFNITQATSRLCKNVSSIRSLGSAALELAYIGAGRFDAMIDLGLKKWDIAAGAVIVKEAGGNVTGVTNNSSYYETGDIAASNYHLHDNLLKLLSAPNATNV